MEVAISGWTRRPIALPGSRLRRGKPCHLRFKHLLDRSLLRGRQVVAYDSGRQRMLADYEAQITRLVMAALLRR